MPIFSRRCPDCGSVVDATKEHDCRPEPSDPSPEGTCSMCGEHYGSYMTHLQTCPGGEKAERTDP